MKAGFYLVFYTWHLLTFIKNLQENKGITSLFHAIIIAKNARKFSIYQYFKLFSRHYLGDADAVLVPGGFGQRGTEGKIAAIGYARRQKIPFLGICLGMQLAIVEFARSVAGLPQAASSELEPDTPDPVIALLPEQGKVVDLGGTLRLGAYPCVLAEGTLARRLYGKKEISERHRHRYEVNNAYREILSKSGMVFSGLSPDGRIVEMIELPKHPFFVATQAHPEFKSRPNHAHPLFEGLIAAAGGKRAKKIEN